MLSIVNSTAFNGLEGHLVRVEKVYKEKGLSLRKIVDILNKEHIKIKKTVNGTSDIQVMVERRQFEGNKGKDLMENIPRRIGEVLNKNNPANIINRFRNNRE